MTGAIIVLQILRYLLLSGGLMMLGLSSGPAFGVGLILVGGLGLVRG